MAKVLIPRSLEDALRSLSDRIRALELRRYNVFGNWTISEDRATGNLIATRNNGSGETPTVVTLAVK